MELVTQQEGLVLSGLKARIINADMDVKSFDRRWSLLPLGVRAMLFVIVPIYVAYLLLFGTREFIAVSLDDLPSRRELLNSDESLDTLDELIVNERDKVLLSNIIRLHETASSNEQLVGILFGAQHMRSVVRLLLGRLGYRILGSEWIRVFEL